MTISICSVFGRGVFNYDLPLSYKFLWRSPPVNSLERSFQFPSPLFLLIPMTISICLLFDRGVFNSHRSFSYKFLWRSPSVYSLKEEFSIRIAPFPINSFDDLHLSTLLKRSFQFQSSPFLKILLTISIYLLFERGVFHYDLSFSYKFLWWSPSVYSLKWSFQLGSLLFL